MDVSVIVPRAGNCPYREEAWGWVQAQYDGLEVVEGFGDPDAWCKADAVADALQHATGDLLVIADADVWSENLADAIRAVEDGVAWATPHTHVRRLTREGTDRFLAGERETAPVEEHHWAVEGGGIVVLPRATYERVPLDRRFVGWGGEDKAWGYALTTLAGKPVRARGFLWHLWHPPQPRQSRTVGSYQNEELRARYTGCRFQRRTMRQLVEEGRCHSPASSPPP